MPRRKKIEVAAEPVVDETKVESTQESTQVIPKLSEVTKVLTDKGAKKDKVLTFLERIKAQRLAMKNRFKS